MNAMAAPKRSDVSGDRQAREALAGVIAEAERTKTEAAKARAAFERAERFAMDARTAVDLARESVEKATAAEGESVAALLENAVEAPAELGMVRSAKDKLADVEDRHAAAKSAAEHLKAQVTALERDAKDAQKRAAAARNDVVILNVDAWIAAEEKLYSELMATRAVMWTIMSGAHQWTEEYKRLDRTLRRESLVRRDDWDRSDTVVQWRAAMDKLLADSKAPVPGPARS